MYWPSPSGQILICAYKPRGHKHHTTPALAGQKEGKEGQSMHGLGLESKRITTKTVDNRRKRDGNQSVPVALHLSAVVVTSVMCLEQSAVDHRHFRSD